MTVKGNGVGPAGRLRIRTKDKRWIDVPYGAGQDTNLRSVNIWDGTQWKCPTWGRLLWTDFFTDPGLQADLDSLLVRLTGVYWSGYGDPQATNQHVYNPNYRHTPTSSGQWTLTYANFERLFYLKPRSDPRYRIVPLRYPLPRRVPNVTLDYEVNPYTDFAAFWPGVTYSTQYFDDNQANSQFNQYGVQDLSYADTYLPYLTQMNYVHSPGPYKQDRFITYTDRRGYQVGNIDLKAIRERIETYWPQQDVNFTGQKHDIRNQLLRRVIVKLKISPFLNWYGEEGQVQGNEFDTVQFSLRVQGNPDTYASMVNDPFHSGQQVPVNIPSDVHPQGIAVWQASASSLDHRTVATHQRYAGSDTRYWNWYQVGAFYDDAAHNIDYIHSFEAPTENNLCFSADINVPVNWQNTFSEIDALLVVRIDRVCLQYSDVNVEVPLNLQRWDALP